MDSEKVITPRKKVGGDINVPGSKSYAQRAIALCALGEDRLTLSKLTECDDVNAALGIIENLGSSIRHEGDLIHIEGGIKKKEKYSINSGEAGLSTRLFSAFSLLTDQQYIVNGKGSILTRPMDMVIDALSQLGKSVKSKQGKLPLQISGETKSGELKLDGSTSSQLLTGILIVAPFLDFDLNIEVDNLKSIPYIEMTLEVMRDFGLSVDHEEYRHFKVKGNQSIKRSNVYEVEGDWSGASFLIVAALVGGDLKMKGLNKNSSQADQAMLNVVKKAGGFFSWEGNDLIVKTNELTPFKFDATHCPDLFPPLVALAAMISGESRITGVHRLKHKESDRASALIQEFSKLGIDVSMVEDDLVVNGLHFDQLIDGGCVDSHNDHRMAMALSLMSLRSGKEILISRPESIKKSYPLFFEDFDQITKESVQND